MSSSLSPASEPIGVAHRPLRQAVHDEVRREIIAGRYQPGERLYEDQIASELNVSRNPVREALQALAVDGFVELEPRRGARVARLSRRKAEDLFDVRESLEGLVARLAARRRTEEQLRQIERHVGAGLSAVARLELTTLPELNTSFHQLLCEAADNPILSAELARLSHLIEWVYSVRIFQRSSNSWAEHESIADAIAAQDEEKAFELACEHIARARAAFFDAAPIDADGR